MKNVLVVFAWTFVLAVACYDVYFAWQYRACFLSWEMNPLARWIAQDFGILTLFGLKLGMLGFALAVAVYCHQRNHRLELPYTLVISGVHLWLSLHYLLGNLAGT
jgi:hypothetical protein